MEIFNLPDLGEGLPDAEIHEWFVKEGDVVDLDQPLVSMETAKAVVDVPAPQAGKIAFLYGKPGDVIKTGMPLVKFSSTDAPRVDKGTVVGNLEENANISEDHFTIGTKATSRSLATPAVRMLAKKSGVDLSLLTGSGEYGMITREDVIRELESKAQPPEGFEPLHGVRRAMLSSMVQSHREVVPVSIFDEADVTSWIKQGDITIRLIRAICNACKAEPALNAWFNTQHSARKCFKEVNLGLAIDSEEGLFVPVIHFAEQHEDSKLRQTINDYKKAIQERKLPPEQFHNATITLSNFGKFAGRFASPIIVPPMVAILAVGRLFDKVVSKKTVISTNQLLPLSLSFDHRAVTGGEATRFLSAVIEALEKSE
jgi:pyruvate dehydrogenase E2 component (dihydrolipoamide acetyltransferase)